MINILSEIPNTDSRRMQPLPWKVEWIEEGKCVTFLSGRTQKSICSFWGGDKRHPDNHSWCTTAQMVAHAKYAEHVLNSYPFIQAELERIYKMEDMPEEAIKAIEAMMEHIYLSAEEMPPHVE